MGICLIVKSGGGIDTSDATATVDKILSGYTVYVNDTKITGTMTNKGTQTGSLSAGGTSTIASGWHNGSGKITANSLSSQTGSTTAGTGDVLTGYTYWSSGSKYTGTMTSRGTKTWTIGANGSQTIESGWHNGSGTVKQSLSTDNSELWRTPGTSQQQLCWSGYYYSKNRWCNGNSNLTASNIKKGISIFGVTGSYYTTTRYLIQNGQLTGLLSSDILKVIDWYSSSTDNKSYDGSTWQFLFAYETGHDEDSGVWINTLIYRRFKNANNIATFNTSKWSCRFHANILINGSWSGWSYTVPGQFNILPRWIYNDSRGQSWAYPYDPWRYSGYLSIPRGTSAPHGNITVNTDRITAYSLWGTSVVVNESSEIKGKVANNDLVFSTSSWCVGGVTHVWCKDLWVETTETTP